MKRLIGLLTVLTLLSLTSWAQAPGPTPVAQPLNFTASSIGSTLAQVGASYKPASTTITYHINGYGCGGCSAPANGVITSFDQASGIFVYKPNSGFLGVDNFGFIVRATTGGGAATDSPITAVNVKVTSEKTKVTWTLKDPFGNPLVGTVGLFLSQTVDSPAGVTPRERAATVTLDGFGKFEALIYPSDSLFPSAAYSVWFYETGTRRQWELGVFHIPASTGTVDLATCGCRELNANRAAQFVFASRAQVDALATQARSFEVKDNGTLVGSAAVLNFIPGSGMTQAIALNSGVIDVMINCASCSGGSLSSSTAGRPAYYSANNVVNGAAFSGAHKIWSSNASSTGMEWKSLTPGAGITITQTPGQYLIEATAQPFVLNSQTGATQSLNTSYTGASQPTWSSSGNTHTLILPYAAPSATGLVNTLAQSFAGLKEFQGGVTIKAPGTLGLLNSGGTQQGFLSDVGIQHKSAAFGGQATLGGTAGAVYVAGYPQITQPLGHNLADYVYLLDNSTTFAAGQYFATSSELKMPANNTYAHTGEMAAVGGFATQSSTAGGSAATMGAFYGLTFADRAGINESFVFKGRGALYQGNVPKHSDFIAEEFVDTGSGTLTTHIGFEAKYFLTGTNRYSFYSNQGGSGEAAAAMSHGGAFELRGVTTANAPTTASSDTARVFFDKTVQKLRVSENGGSYYDLTRNRAARNCTGAVTLDFQTGQTIECTLTGNVTSVTATNFRDGENYTVLFRQQAGGGRTIAALSSSIKVYGGGYSTNSNTTASNGVDVMQCGAANGALYCVYLLDVK